MKGHFAAVNAVAPMVVTFVKERQQGSNLCGEKSTIVSVKTYLVTAVRVPYMRERRAS